MIMDRNNRYQRFPYFVVLILVVLAHATGLLNDIFISDSALYASIAKEMVRNNQYLDLTLNGVDWLDKPHLQFWITALSYKIFGINAFAYKLPAILFTFLTLFFTYRLTRELYNEKTALLAVLVLATAYHLVLSNNDVRAEAILTALITGSIYSYHKVVRGAGITCLILGSFFAGMAVMTKGLFSLIPIIGAVGGELLITRNWKMLLSWKWILGAGLILLFIGPELYALYHQFDSHPEKTVFGTTGVSGICFFLWDSQFGRFFNTGPIQGSGDPFFFLHTLLWAFLPWSVIMYYALYRRIRDNLPRRRKDEEFYTVSGALLSLLVFSFSGFQLPHYTNVIFPLLAIMTAAFIQKSFHRNESRFYSISQWTVIFMITISLIILHLLYRPVRVPVYAVVGLLMAAGGVMIVRRTVREGKTRIFYYSCLASVLLNFYLNLIFYPDILRYQSGARAAEHANLYHPGEGIRTIGALPFTLSFHSDAQVRHYRTMHELLNDPAGEDYLVFTMNEYLDSLEMQKVPFRIIETLDHFHTTTLNGKFLNHKTRKAVLQKRYLLEVLTNNE
jgi:4-amino-4-deoxy-L-arabinose transferase-like glycosyltransferase